MAKDIPDRIGQILGSDSARTLAGTAVTEALKAFGGQLVPGGSIIVRQRGTRIKPGLNVGKGKDDTLFAKVTGTIKFIDKGRSGRFVMIEPAAQA